jgi:hypothetical protein
MPEDVETSSTTLLLPLAMAARDFNNTTLSETPGVQNGEKMVTLELPLVDSKLKLTEFAVFKWIPASQQPTDFKLQNDQCFFKAL